MLQASADEVLAGGSKGSGKSVLLVAKPLYQTHKPNYKALVLRETYGELQEILDRMHRMYLRLPVDQRPVWHGDNERRRWEFPSGAKIKLGYYRRKEDISHYQGQEWSDILFDEIGNLEDEGALEVLLAEMRSPDPTIRRQFVCTANPGGRFHGVLRRRFINLCGKQGERIVHVKRRLPSGQIETVTRQFVPGRVTDNPIYANDPKYMARLMSLPDRLRRCLLDGDWDAATGAAFDELDPDAHLVKPFECPSHWPYVAAFDWGYSHWAVFGWGRVSEDGRVYVNDTLRWRHFQDWDLVEAIKEMVPHQALRSVQAGHDLWHELRANRGDGTPTRAEYYQSKGIGVTQANIMRAAGYANMMQYIAHRETPYIQKRLPAIRFFDTPGNRWLVEEHLPSIVVNPDNPADVLKTDSDAETGEGGDDGYDCFVAGTKIVTRRGDVPIESVSASDEVMTRKGWRHVLASWCTGPDREVYRVRTQGGRELIGTAAHPVWVDGRGFVRLDSLRYGDTFRHGDGSSDSTLRIGSACSVAVFGRSTNTSRPSAVVKSAPLDFVLSVEPVGSAQVYNLQTTDPDAAEYYANGILVHNCLRYLLSRRPFRAPSKMPLVLSASSDFVLRREAEKVYRPDLTEPDPNRPHPRLPGQLATPYFGT
jgi:hypothetical protein